MTFFAHLTSAHTVGAQTQSRLHFAPANIDGEYIRITPEIAGWEHLSFATRRISEAGAWEAHTGDFEYGLVILGGVCSIHSSRGNWPKVGRRPNVFAGMPYGLYLPPDTDFKVTALTPELDIAYGWCQAQEAPGSRELAPPKGGQPRYSPRLVTPKDSAVEIRGGGSATRQINSIFPPGFQCHRLVAVEVYTPPGNWSSYPPHKHDVHRVDEHGELIEADLEEIYFYKLDHSQGFAIQRVYTADKRLDETIVARNNEVVLVPEGYHPVASAAGYTTYYLNFLAGSAQSLANTDDPDHAWVKTTWKDKDPRMPVVSLEMENRG